MTLPKTLLLHLLRDWMALTGNVPPTFREIADQLGYPTTGLVWRDLMALRDLGLIDWEAGNEMTLRITAAGLHQSTDIESETMSHYHRTNRTGAERNRCASAAHDQEIITMFKAGRDRATIARHIHKSQHFVTDRLISAGLLDGFERNWDSTAPHIVKELDDQYVAACLEQGGFLYRTIVAGRMVEVRP
jgi:hypothetical protein